MQGFAGISLFSVLLLMALGLAIIFGQMGVINMAHGEFMAAGAYTTYLISSLTETYIPAFMPYYFVFSIAAAFLVAGTLGYLAEFILIRHLYNFVSNLGLEPNYAAVLPLDFWRAGSESHFARLADGFLSANRDDRHSH
jgi:branched-subunit amino acid ABC-type transport system permease component